MFFQGLDQAGYEVNIKNVPQRIVCTVPSLTELLFDLGLEEKIIGVTRFCVRPQNARKKAAIIGGTKDIDLNTLRKLRPDLIIGNKEENVKDQISEAKKLAPVWLSDVNNLNDARRAIEEIGKITHTFEKAAAMSKSISAAEEELRQIRSPQKSALYFIWKNPYMVAGKNSFINAMLSLCGLQNIAPEENARYPALSLEQIQEIEPEVIILSSEPYPFCSGDLHQIAEKLPRTQAYLLNGEIFSWYGSRLIPALKYIRSLKLKGL